MKEKILNLRAEGKTYNEIKQILGCSKSTISYHCGEGQKKKTRERDNKRKKDNILIKKVDSFKYSKIKTKTNHFCKADYFNGKRIENTNVNNFTWKDVIEKFGENTKCYISGVDINLFKSEYAFDHIIPVSKNGESVLSNLGITHKQVNQMKSDMSPEELLNWCEIILKNNGYIVNKFPYVNG